jgi:hypothetical protein
MGGIGLALLGRIAAQRDDVADARSQYSRAPRRSRPAGADAGEVRGSVDRVSRAIRSTVAWVRARVEPPAP